MAQGKPPPEKSARMVQPGVDAKRSCSDVEFTVGKDLLVLANVFLYNLKGAIMKFKFLAILFVAILLGACRTAPMIYQVQNAAVSTNLPNASKDDVRKAIIRAGGSLGWQFRDNGADAMIGTLVLRTHTAVVDIPYSAKQYSITYKDSTNLNYDGTSIHSNYNGWIQNLHKAINIQLNTF